MKPVPRPKGVVVVRVVDAMAVAGAVAAAAAAVRDAVDTVVAAGAKAATSPEQPGRTTAPRPLGLRRFLDEHDPPGPGSKDVPAGCNGCVRLAREFERTGEGIVGMTGDSDVGIAQEAASVQCHW